LSGWAQDSAGTALRMTTRSRGWHQGSSDGVDNGGMGYDVADGDSDGGAVR
jgi:hypothetical protein